VVPSELIGKTIAAIVTGERLPEDSEAGRPAEDPDSGNRLTSVCPECGGVLTERNEAGVPYWQCHVGHRYSPSSFVHAQAQGVEAALWTAIRALRDRGAVLRRMADQSEVRGRHRSARNFRRKAEEAYRQADFVRHALADAATTTLADLPDTASDEAAEAASAH